MTALRVAGDSVRATYLGYGLTIGARSVAIRIPDGHWLADCRSIVAARKRIRSHRGIGRST